MDDSIQIPKTLKDAICYFEDQQACVNAIAFLRWADGVPTCPRCANKDHYWLDTQKRWKCKKCGRQFSVKQGTIFEDSPLSLDKWLMALWMLVNCKNGVSSHEVAKDLGITQKSAWFMLHRLRLALRARSFEVKLGGEGGGAVEADETFIGPKLRRMHKSKRDRYEGKRGAVGKIPVMGMLDRDTRQIRAKVIPNVKRETLQNEILENIQPRSTVYTDQGGRLREPRRA